MSIYAEDPTAFHECPNCGRCLMHKSTQPRRSFQERYVMAQCPGCGLRPYDLNRKVARAMEDARLDRIRAHAVD